MNLESNQHMNLKKLKMTSTQILSLHSYRSVLESTLPECKSPNGKKNARKIKQRRIL